MAPKRLPPRTSRSRGLLELSSFCCLHRSGQAALRSPERHDRGLVDAVDFLSARDAAQAMPLEQHVQTPPLIIALDIGGGEQPAVMPFDAVTQPEGLSLPSQCRILSSEDLVPDATPVASRRMQASAGHYRPVLSQPVEHRGSAESAIFSGLPRSAICTDPSFARVTACGRRSTGIADVPTITISPGIKHLKGTALSDHCRGLCAQRRTARPALRRRAQDLTRMSM